MSSKNNKISIVSSIASSYHDKNYYSLYLKLKDFTDTTLPSKLLDEVQTIKKAVTDIHSSIESNYDGSTVQLSLDNLEAMIRNLTEKETFISDKLIPAFKLIPKLRKLLIKKYSISSTKKNGSTYYDSYTEDFDSSDEEGVLTSLASSIDTLSDSLGFDDYISEEYSTSFKYDKEIESVINKIRKLLRDDQRYFAVKNGSSSIKEDTYETYYDDYDTVDEVRDYYNVSDEDAFDYMESTSTGAFEEKLMKKVKNSTKKKSSSKDFDLVEVDKSTGKIKKISKNKAGEYVDAYNTKDFQYVEASSSSAKKKNKTSKKKSSSKDFDLVEVDKSTGKTKKVSKNKAGEYVDSYNTNVFQYVEADDDTFQALLKKSNKK